MKKNQRSYTVPLELLKGTSVTILLDKKTLDEMTFDNAGRALFEIKLVKQLHQSDALHHAIVTAAKDIADQIANEWISR